MSRAAGVVGDHRVRHAVPAQLPCGQRRPLVARSRLVGKDVNSDAVIVRLIDRRGGSTDIDRRQPSGIAMGEHVDRLTGLLAPGGRFDQR